jgi:hypothetical protein
VRRRLNRQKRIQLIAQRLHLALRLIRAPRGLRHPRHDQKRRRNSNHRHARRSLARRAQPDQTSNHRPGNQKRR